MYSIIFCSKVETIMHNMVLWANKEQEIKRKTQGEAVEGFGMIHASIEDKCAGLWLVHWTFSLCVFFSYCKSCIMQCHSLAQFSSVVKPLVSYLCDMTFKFLCNPNCGTVNSSSCMMCCKPAEVEFYIFL